MKKLKIQKKAWRISQAFFIALILSACHSIDGRIETAESIGHEAGFAFFDLPSEPFPLKAASKNLNNHREPIPLTIVIEGDGFAWKNRYSISENPTPLDPTGLEIAAVIRGPVLYLARPCHYIFPERCHPRYWTEDRFAPEIIQSYESAFDLIKARHAVSGFHIVGYSGSAYIALQLANTRTDIRRITTIAGVLDPHAWTEFHDIARLNLNEDRRHRPSSLTPHPSSIPMTHYCGLEDDVVPCALTQSYIENHRTKGIFNHDLRSIPEAEHEDIAAYLDAENFK